MYELLARTDCENARRLKNLDVFYQPVRNPDGRDGVTRTSAFGFDHNRDFGTQNQIENKLMLPEINKYPGLFFIDAHQQGSGYFFPPNEDPVHHEISDFSLDFIQNGIGPALQRAFNDQSAQYQNYNSYDMFTPEYGDTVPVADHGRRRHDVREGQQRGLRQAGLRPLPRDRHDAQRDVGRQGQLLDDWVRQWGEAVDQGQDCALQPNKLVSPLHDTIKQQPKGTVCGYFFKPGQHTADTAALLQRPLQSTGVKVFTLDTPVAVNGYHEFGNSTAGGTPLSVNGQTLPAGTLYIPMAQGMKHWIQAVLGENPFIPYDYYYDVVTWSYPLQRGLSGSGFLTTPMSPGVGMTRAARNANFGTVPTGSNAVYAFNTDSARGLALAIDLLDKGVNVYRGDRGLHRRGQAVLLGRGARRRRVAGRQRRRTSRRWPQAQHAGDGADELPGRAQAAGQAEDRPVHGRGDDSVEPAVHRRARTSTAPPATARSVAAAARSARRCTRSPSRSRSRSRR